MKQDRKKRLYELRDAHFRRAAADRSTEGRGSAPLAGTDINGFLREIVKQKQKRNQQRTVIEDFFENPAAYNVDDGFVPAKATQAEREARKQELELKLEKVRAVLETLECEIRALAGGDSSSETPDDRAADIADDDAVGGESILTADRDTSAGNHLCRLAVRRNGEDVEDIVLGREKLLIGRRSVNDVCLRDRAVSGRHALIVPDGPNWLVVDLGSTNGTQVNGQAIHLHVLEDRDQIKLGHCELTFRESSAEATSQPAAAVDFAKTAVLDEGERQDS